jgi:hypothetical protein
MLIFKISGWTVLQSLTCGRTSADRSEVITSGERYRGLVITNNNRYDDDKIEKQFKKFNSYVIAFSRFYSEEEKT